MATGSRDGRSRLHRCLSAALVVLAVTSAALLGTLAVGTALDQWRFAPVLSGSMEPGISKGAMVVAEPVATDDLRAGDILLFNAPTEGHPLVVHRIYDVAAGRHGSVFHTKGDANDGPDVWTIRIRGDQAWRVRRAIPYVGSAVEMLANAGSRMIVLVVGAVLLTVWGLRELWALRPISWRADDPYGVERRRRARRASVRAATVLTVGLLAVGLLGGAGLAYAKFTATPAPPGPGFSSGTLPAPTGLGCRWTSTSALSLSWTGVAAGFATSYDVQRGNASGGPYSTIGSVSPLTTTTYSDTSAGPPTLRAYVVTSKRATWDSPVSNQVLSTGCIGAIGLVAGTSAGFSGDGGAATSAQLSAPRGVAVDGAGNVYIADTTNNRIRRIDGATGVISTIAGGGTNTACAYTGAATTVSLSTPRGVAVDSAGTVYIADTGRNCIRKVVAGTVSQVAGGGSSTACTFSGAAGSVSLSAPGGVAVSSAGTVYIADTSRNCVRSVTGTTVAQVAGGGSSTACTFSGAAGSVSLSAPSGVAIDASGRVLIADSSRRCVRMVGLGAVAQVAGTGTSGTTGDGGPAIGALLSTPASVAAGAGGDVWIADAGASRVRRVEGPL